MQNFIAEKIGNMGKNNVPSFKSIEKTEIRTNSHHLTYLDADSINPVVDKIFFELRGTSSMTSNLARILLWKISNLEPNFTSSASRLGRLNSDLKIKFFTSRFKPLLASVLWSNLSLKTSHSESDLTFAGQ